MRRVRAGALVAVACLVACARADEGLSPLDEAGRAMLDPRRARTIDRDGLVSLLLARGSARGKTVADVGSGPGAFAEPLARAVGPGGTLVLTDVRADYLSHARHRALGAMPGVGVRTQVPRAGHLDLGARSVDAVLMVQVDHLFGPRREAMLLEAFDALRAGGRALIAGTPRNRVPEEIVIALRARGAVVNRAPRRAALERVTVDR